MAVEILVLCGQEGAAHQAGDERDRHIHPALMGVFADQRAVCGIDAGGNRRLVILERLGARKVMGDGKSVDVEGNEAEGDKAAKTDQHTRHDAPQNFFHGLRQARASTLPALTKRIRRHGVPRSGDDVFEKLRM